tara:strand:- start:36589 stop:37191 length:603 start_codon:yes stop_codon:yes gene_type:complete
MLEKDMFLKNKYIFLTLFFIFIIKSSLASERNNLTNVIDHLSNLNNFSVSFLQNNNQEISEGKISIGNKRVRVDYKTPTKILIILDKDKAMYYNYDLDEDEFFNPKETSAWFFFEIFNNLNFLLDSEIKTKEKNIILRKEGLANNEKYTLKIYLENKPILLRKVELILENEKMTLSFFDHNYNENFPLKFFKLINPTFFN